MTTVTCAFCGGTAEPAIRPADLGKQRQAYCRSCFAAGPIAPTPAEALSRFRSAVPRTEHERAVEGAFVEGVDYGGVGWSRYAGKGGLPEDAWRMSKARAALSHAEPAEQGGER